MNKYTIYCTAEQTKKALELGASIKLLLDDFTDNYEDCEVYAIPPQEDELGIMCNYAVIPTAEQMIGFLLNSGRGYSVDLATLIKECGYKQGCLTFIDSCLK